MQREIDRSFLEMLDCGDPYLRRNFIGASDAPIIMGVSPWRKPIDLYREKCGLIAQQQENWAMARGTQLEPIARAAFEKEMDVKVFPKRLFSDEYPWMMASLDGISEDRKIAVEIKCPGLACHREALEGKIPERYYPQLQHQMFVAGLEFMYYFSWTEVDYISVFCEFDQKYAEKMIEKEIEFWNCVLTGMEPPSEYQCVEDLNWAILSNNWAHLQRKKKSLEQEESALRQEILNKCGGENSKGYGLTAKKIIKKGSINYAAIPELKDVDIEKFRKEGSEYWKITLDGDEEE